MTTTHPRKIQAGYEPIAGYTLEQLIGRGGFGEVWRADAPGGLKKAVKFVFGATEQHRATRELRSLERIKGVHHPFLLTLERFEIVDDQLVIITELADGSLEDVFNRHRERGSCGVPRAAMLSYMHDAADALDYLHQSYQLQHLDIKPGNLLLVGGHVKVADFGLLKDLKDEDCSVIGGLTPIYAPPEVFDGRPSVHSDQYSLAVMYQELLTGTRPFGGRTIAQLATQHVNSSPDLEPLPPSDRPVIARALEKDPQRRYDSCKEFVDALRSPRGRTSVSGRGAELHGGDTVTGNAPFDGMSNDAVVQDLPQLKADSSKYLVRITGHALVVAIGGTGADCLHSLRGRVGKLYAASPLDLHSVLIDTDAETIYASGLSEASGIVPPCQTIHTPLKAPMEYRHEGAERLASMSRRWIYNVPRSRTTEGMRPLGRLALVDHAADVVQTLRHAISHLAAVCGDRTPSIYLVGSLSGGTASGMFVDIVHLLRHLLDESGLEQATVLPVLSMQSLRPDSNRPLGIHDSCAALLEMRHFMQPGNGYPGDPGAGFPRLPAARTPLKNAYIVASSPQQSVSTTVETIVDYIWANSTGAGALLAASRKTDGDEQSTELGAPTIRSVGVVRLGAAMAFEEKVLAPATVRLLLLRWLGRPAEAKPIAVPLAERLMRRCNLQAESVRESIRSNFGADALECRSRILSALKQLPAGAAGNPVSIQKTIENLVESSIGQSYLESLVASKIASLQQELSIRLQDRRIDITSAIEAVRLLIEQTKLQANLLVEASVCGGSSWQTRDLHTIDTSCDFAEKALDEWLTKATIDRLQVIADSFSKVSGRLVEVATLLAQSVHLLNQDEAVTNSNPWNHLPAEIASRLEQTLGHLHQRVSTPWLVRLVLQSEASMNPANLLSGVNEVASKVVKATIESITPAGFNPLGEGPSVPHLPAQVSDSSPLSATLTSSLNRQSTSVTEMHSTHITSAGNSTTTRPVKAKPQSPMEVALSTARPTLLACGGRQRLILIAGSESERLTLEKEIRAIHAGALTVAVIPGMTPMLVHEAQQIKLDDVIGRLAMVAAGSHQVTQRLHARSDVDFS